MVDFQDVWNVEQELLDLPFAIEFNPLRVNVYMVPEQSVFP